MKVAVLIPSVSGGGAEFVATQWAQHLSRRGHSVSLLVTHPREGEVEDFVGGGVEIYQVDGSSLGRRVLALRSHLAQNRPDVLLSLMPHWNITAILATRQLRRRPRVFISGRNIETALRRVQRARYGIEIALAKALYRHADGYIAISHPTAAEAVGAYGVPLEKIWVVPNPAAGKSGISPEDRRSPTVVEKGVPLTLSVPARLVDQKRPHLAVETARILADEYGVPTSVEYFGAGPLLESTLALGERLSVPVTVHGWVGEWYRACAPNSLVLLPSMVEGFGNVLVEAAAAGIPAVVSSRALGAADAVVPGITGTLALSDTPSSYAEAVLRAGRLARTDYSGWLARFTAEASADLLEVALGLRED